MHPFRRSAIWLYLLLWQLSDSAFVNVVDGLSQVPSTVSSNGDQPQPSDTLSVDSQAPPIINAQSPPSSNQNFHPNNLDASLNKETLQFDNQASSNLASQLINQAPPLSNNKVPLSNNEIPQSNNQALQANNQAPPANNQAPQANNQAPQANNQAPQANNQAAQANNQAPQANNQASQANNQAAQANNQAPQANNQAPQANNQAPLANNQAPQFFNQAWQLNNEDPESNNQPPQFNGQAQVMNNQAQFHNGQIPTSLSHGPLPTGSGGQGPLPTDQIKPTHTFNAQWRAPAGNIRPPPVPPGGRAPPPQGRAPPHPPPPPHPHPPVRRGMPSFLIPSSDSSNAFDGTEASFVYVLPSRHRQCFHHRSVKPFMFEFHVLYGGKLDINAYVVGPDGRIIYESRDRRQGRFVASSIVAVKNTTEGSNLPLYTVCLDNRFSTWYAKVVDFNIELSTSRRGENKVDNSESSASSVEVGPLPEELTAELDRLNISWAQFLELTSAVEDNLHQTASFQRQLRSDETRDRMTMEDSASCVTNWSLLQLIVMIAVSTLQVLMIRALFDEKSLFHRVWKSKGVFLGRS